MPRLTVAPDSVNPCVEAVDGLLQGLGAFVEPKFRLGIAFSGGADSTALLHALATRFPGRIHAIHIHHGLQAVADHFVMHCEAQCKLLDVPLSVVYVNGRPKPGESPEDAARKARYAALAHLAQQQGLGHLALAQHADDQVETLLLALTRGAGLPGLASMPTRFERFGVVFHRPLLAVSSMAIRQWLVRENRTFIEDPSNTDESLTRNRIRRQVLPVLDQSFPGFRSQFARSARHAAQGKRLLESLAQMDLAQTGMPPVISSLQKLDADRQSNALRYWLKSIHSTTPSDAQLQELLKQIGACLTRGHRIQLKVGSGQIQRMDKQLIFLPDG